MPSHIPVPREFSVYTGFTKPIAQDLRLDRQLVALRERARAAAMEVSPDPLTPRAVSYTHLTLPTIYSV